MRLALTISFFCWLHFSFLAQLNFTSVPIDRQMFPRGKDNIGRFVLSGTAGSDIQALKICILRNHKLPYVYNELTTVNSDRTFSVNLSFRAELADYDLEIYAVDGDGKHTLKKTVSELVAGDFYIVGGQSNAVAGSSNDSVGLATEKLYSNAYCRSIGLLYERAISKDSETNTYYVSLEEDCRFYKPTCIYWGYGSVGVWPLKLMSDIAQQTGIPVCFVNGGQGATELTKHLPSNFPSDANKLQYEEDWKTGKQSKPYDRQFYKLNKYGLTQAVKGIFWYQGESDGALSKESAENYNQRFGQLRQAWKADYPNLEKIFVFQINTGCGGDNLGIIRDQQRKLSDAYNDVIVLPSVGSGEDERATDGCHYSVKGHVQLGSIISPVVLKTLYNIPYNNNRIMAPVIQSVGYLTPEVIDLEFDKDVSVQQSCDYERAQNARAYLKDYFFREGKVKIALDSVNAQGNHVFLYLSKLETKVLRLTYLPDIFAYVPSVYMGPWIVNKENERLGALSFFEFPVIRSWKIKLKSSEEKGGGQIAIYPNPASDSISILCEEKIQSVTVFDSKGTKLGGTDLVEQKELIHYDVSRLPQGIYFLMFQTDKGSEFRKIIISRP